MLQIYRAEDGEVFQVNATLWDIEKAGSLELFLHQEVGVDQEAAIAYLSDGRRLNSENVRELAGAPDQAIYVFNKYYLDEELDLILQELHMQPPLQPPIEDDVHATPPFRPSQLAASYLRVAHTHHMAIVHTAATIRSQHISLGVASSSLDLHVLTLADTFDGVSANAQKELAKQASLLRGIDADLEMIARVDIHREFVSAAVRRAMDNGDRGRTLGDYVSNAKMRQVAEVCVKSHDSLRHQFQEAEANMKRLTDGSADVRLVLSDTRIVDEADDLARRSQEWYDQISEAASSSDSPVDSEQFLRELRHLDGAIRTAVTSIAELKNMSTEQSMKTLRRISLLNHDLIQLPTAMASLDTTLRGRNSFTHIQRLHNMIYAYGATVIEIVRRKEFARFFYQRAQIILDVMAKLSSSERKRRHVYRGDIYGQLPFDLKGMDDPSPTIDFTTAGINEDGYSFERSDVDAFFNMLTDLEDYVRNLRDGDTALESVREIRANVEKLVQKMDSLEPAFDRIAERSLLSSSRLALSRRRLSDADSQAFDALAVQLRETEQAKLDQETAHDAEREAMEQEIAELRRQLHSSAGEREHVGKLDRDLHQARAQLEGETTARRIMEDRHRDLLDNVDRQRLELTQALAEATNQTKTAEILRQQLTQARAEFEEVKALESRSSARLANLLEIQETTQRKFEEARSRGEDMEAQFQAMRDEREEVRRALDESRQEKDRLLRAQASEHDRQMRDYVAEADGDRAVLEHQFFELRAEMEDMERQLKEVTAQLEMKDADAVGLREELQRLECELRDVQRLEDVLRGDLKDGRASQSNFECKLEESNRLVAQLLDVAIAYRTAHFKALNVAQAAVSHPSISKSIAHLGESQVFSSNGRHVPLAPLEEPSPIDPSDPPAALEILRSFDQDHFLEVVAKTGTTIRKWQKQCKEYRERSKGKISFRNFAKGDLALFLPTRNSVSKPWAAFNVSFPHYFLQATENLAEQLKNREWIVARITSITERVVVQKDPTSNPYGLGDGVKYYMLEVEDWTQPATTPKRRGTSRRISSSPRNFNDPPQPLSASPTLTPPPENQVEETFPEARGPDSHHHRFPPVRSRANSSPIAGPSSLSRLLAQAPPSASIPASLDPIPHSPMTRTPSPFAPPSPRSASPVAPDALPSPPLMARASSSSLAPSPPNPLPMPRAHGASPLRPGSRASRLSTSSRFSAGRLPPFGSAATPAVKATPTTALTPAPVAEGSEESIPSPTDSLGDGMASILSTRRRTTSYHVGPTSPLAGEPEEREADKRTSKSGGGALASLASWSASFSRRRSSMARTTNVSVDTGTERLAEQSTSASAKDLLSKF
ncbi:putative peripheral membrane protein [Amylostereum chailletii]|nr:putative peripheral membrane protein [Amylostereum chailletii]